MKFISCKMVIRSLAFVLPMIFVLYFFSVVIFTMSPMRLLDGTGEWFSPPCDISYGLAECECLRRGVDPYDVWRGAVVVEGYKPGLMSPPSCHEYKDSDAPVNVHPPWFYSAILPFTFFPTRIAIFIHYLIMFCCVVWLLFVGWGMARKEGCSKSVSTVFSFSAVLFISLPMFQDFHSANWALMTLAAAVGMACCLNAGKDALAGVCWAFLMIKPQVGLVFAVPILMGRKFTTLFVAIGCCLLASLPPAVLSNTSILQMILITPSSNYTQFWGCGTMPKLVADLLPQSTAISLGLLVGCAVCVIMTKCMMKMKDWFFVLMPAAICSSLWTYSRCYGHVMAWFFFIVLFTEIYRNTNLKRYWIILICSVFLFPRANNFLHMFTELAFPSINRSWLDGLHLQVDSIVSFLSLCLAIVLSLQIRKVRSFYKIVN